MSRRHDIQGLRAIAVLLVVLCHAGVPVLRGGFVGVDVFFVLSGFLITGLLLADSAGGGTISLGEFYARRARRILPAAALTLMATDVAAHHLLNFVRAREVTSDSLWAAGFAANVHFMREGTDYFAQGQPASPLLHFWTLGVEEQFYLVWPALLALVLLVSGRRLLLGVVLAGGGASLCWSIVSTRPVANGAYYSAFARAWELGLGAALAIALPRLARLPSRVRSGAGWLGLLAIAGAAVGFSSATPFPGYAAALPAGGTALVLVGAGSVPRLLGLAPLRYVGDRSYALYLWHWPVLAIAALRAGHELPLRVNLLLALVAFGLSIASYRLFENPIRHARVRPRSAVLVWPSTAATVVALALFILHSLAATAAHVDLASAAVRVQPLVRAAAVQAPKPLPAVVAAVRAAQRGSPLPTPLTPPVDRLHSDFYSFPSGCTPAPHATKSTICRLGAVEARKTIAVIGDSHAQMWMPAILAMAQRDGWAVIPFVKVSCIPRLWAGRGECGTWLRWARARAQALRPDVTLIVGSRAGTRDPVAGVKPVAALSTSMKRFSPSVIVVGDEPSQTRDPVDCLLAPGATMKTCTGRSTRAQLRAEAAVAADARRDHVGFIDALHWFCARPAGSAAYLCPMVVNQTITAIDRGHASKTYVLELAPLFRTAFRRELFR